jgi:anti-anti-sigma regulatory factor
MSTVLQPRSSSGLFYEPPNPLGQTPRSDVTRCSFQVEGVQVDAGITLHLYGGVDNESVPALQAVLDGLAVLQPERLVIDLSEVDQVSPEALSLFEISSGSVNNVVLRAPSVTIRGDLVTLGLSQLLENVLVL